MVGGTASITSEGNLILDSGAVADIPSLVSAGEVTISPNSTLNLTNVPNGITDIAAGQWNVDGTFNAGSNNALANLNSVEGGLILGNAQTTTVTPGSGTLTVTGGLYVTGTTTALTILGNLNSNGEVSNTYPAVEGGTLNVGGTFTIQEGGDVSFGAGGVINVGGALVNNGTLELFEKGSTLNVSGTLTNSGTISLGQNVGKSATTAANELTIGASSVNSGTITLFDGIITGATASVVLTNEKTIEGGGNIGDGSMGLVNSSTGKILASSSIPLVIQASSAGFQNNGTIQVNAKETLSITGAANSFLNFNSSNGTLTGGTYLVLGTLEFDNANIVTNAANITLSGPTAIIEDQKGDNGLSNFAANASAGSITVESGQNLTTSVAFSNAGKLTIASGSAFTVGGMNSYAQTLGTTTVKGTLDSGGVNVSGGSVSDTGAINTNSYSQTAGITTVKGTLSVGSLGAVTLSGGSIVDTGMITTGSYTQNVGTMTVNGSLTATSPSGVNLSGGSVFGLGAITGNIDLTGGLLGPGSASKKPGELTVNGTYTQSGSGAFDADLGGTTAGTQYDVLNITSTATLGGVLNVDLISGFKPTVGETFDIMDYTSETGTFTALNLPKLTGGDTWSISYNATDVVLTVDGPSAAAEGAVSGSPATRVSRELMAGGSAASTREPAAILSRVTCYGARVLEFTSCGTGAIANGASRGEKHQLPPMVEGGGTVHNNVMVATRSISAAGGASHESSVAATSMARLYACAYLPSSVALTMGCN